MHTRASSLSQWARSGRSRCRAVRWPPRIGPPVCGLVYNIRHIWQSVKRNVASLHCIAGSSIDCPGGHRALFIPRVWSMLRGGDIGPEVAFGPNWLDEKGLKCMSIHPLNSVRCAWAYIHQGVFSRMFQNQITPGEGVWPHWGQPAESHRGLFLHSHAGLHTESRIETCCIKYHVGSMPEPPSLKAGPGGPAVLQQTVTNSGLTCVNVNARPDRHQMLQNTAQWEQWRRQDATQCLGAKGRCRRGRGRPWCFHGGIFWIFSDIGFWKCSVNCVKTKNNTRGSVRVKDLSRPPGFGWPCKIGAKGG